MAATNEEHHGTSSESVINLWQTRTWRLLHTLHKHQAFALSPDSKTLFAGDDDNFESLELWDTRSGKLRHRLMGYRTNITLSPNGRLMAGRTRDGKIGIWDARSGHRLRLISAREVNDSYYFSPDSKLLASAVIIYKPLATPIRK